MKDLDGLHLRQWSISFGEINDTIQHGILLDLKSPST